MTALCPFCQIPVEEKQQGVGINQHLSRICLNLDCRKDNLHNLSRWSLQLTVDGQRIVFYRYSIKRSNNNYTVIAQCHWTRLYYTSESMGAMSQSPIIELPKMLHLEEPYLEAANNTLDRLLSLVIFL